MLHGRRNTTRPPKEVPLPLIQVNQMGLAEVVVVIPGWNAKTCAMAHRIAAGMIEELGAANWPWYAPKIERGAMGVSTVLREEIPSEAADRVHAAAQAIVGALENACLMEAHVRTATHRVGLQTYRVEVKKVEVD